MSKGLKIRERYEATCQGYDELYRSEQFEKYFVALKKVPPRGRILDAGCGTGLLMEYMATTGLLSNVYEYACLDYSPCMASIAAWRAKVLCPGRCHIVVATVDSIPFQSSYFDVVYSFTVLDLVDDLEASVSELLRVSRGPVVVSMMKSLPYKDRILPMSELLGVTSKDVVMKLGSHNSTR